MRSKAGEQLDPHARIRQCRLHRRGRAGERERSGDDQRQSLAAAERSTRRGQAPLVIGEAAEMQQPRLRLAREAPARCSRSVSWPNDLARLARAALQRDIEDRLGARRGERPRHLVMIVRRGPRRATHKAASARREDNRAARPPSPAYRPGSSRNAARPVSRARYLPIRASRPRVRGTETARTAAIVGRRPAPAATITAKARCKASETLNNVSRLSSSMTAVTRIDAAG